MPPEDDSPEPAPDPRPIDDASGQLKHPAELDPDMLSDIIDLVRNRSSIAADPERWLDHVVLGIHYLGHHGINARRGRPLFAGAFTGGTESRPSDDEAIRDGEELLRLLRREDRPVFGAAVADRDAEKPPEAVAIPPGMGAALLRALAWMLIEAFT